MTYEETEMDGPSLSSEVKTPEWNPSKQDALSRWEINIQFMSRGCVIRVGCKTIPFSSTEEAISELQKYFENPHETQEEWSKLLS